MATERLLPTGPNESSSGSITYSSGSAASALLDDDDGDANYIDFTSDGFISMNYTDLSVTPAAINSITLTLSARIVGAPANEQFRLFVKDPGGTKHYSGYVDIDGSAFPNSYTFAWGPNPGSTPAGEPWTAPATNALIAGVEISGWSSNNVRVSFLPADVDYYGIQASLIASRYVASLDLFHNRRPQSFGSFEGSMDSLDVAIGGRVSLEHVAGPHPTAEGWEDEAWQREMFVIDGHSIDLNTMTVKTELWHERPFLATVWFPAWSDKVSGVIEDGIPRFSVPGSVFQCERTSSASFTNPAGEPDEVPANVPVYSGGGLQAFAASGGRADDIIQIEFDEDSILVPASNFTIQCQAILATVTGAYQTVLYLEYDVNNAFSLHYNGGAGEWQFNVVIGGAFYSATLTATPSAATWYQIGARFSGAEGENDDAPYTLSIFVDRVQGTDDVASGPFVIPASGPWDLKIGRSDIFGGSFLGGQIRKLHIAQYAMTDLEMTRTI